MNDTNRFMFLHRFGGPRMDVKLSSDITADLIAFSRNCALE